MMPKVSDRQMHALRFGGILSIALFVILVDRLTKSWIMSHFDLGDSRRVWSYFYLTYVQNTGSAFGIFQGNNRALLIFALGVLGFLLYSARGFSERGGWWGSLGVALVLGGAIGNVIDRIHYGRVIDFLDFRVWPVFNVADSCITVGAISLALSFWMHRSDA